MSSATAPPPRSARAQALIDRLGLLPHPEGGHYREVFRSPHKVIAGDGLRIRSALTTIDFLLCAGEFSAWHRVASDEVWHLLEGDGLRLSLLPPDGMRVETVLLDPARGERRHVVPAGWWQAAEPTGDFAYCAATVGPGFDFADFSFGRDDDGFMRVLREHGADRLRLA